MPEQGDGMGFLGRTYIEWTISDVYLIAEHITVVDVPVSEGDGTAR
jgi:hypothetical protein